MARHERFVAFFLLLLGFVSNVIEAHECQRLCVENEMPKKCVYRFVLEISQGKNENATSGSGSDIFLSINKKWPGPMIAVCQNDTIVVDVKNLLPFGMETSLHWYGMTEDNSPFMDGVPMITQCPILPHVSFQYRMTASKVGTFYYRAHSVSQQLDGLFGPLIISPRQYHAYPSKTLVISPQMETFQSLDSGYEANLNVTALRFEEYSDSYGYSGTRDGGPHRLRVINAAALDCPVTIYTHTVPLKIVAIDGNDVRPTPINEITVYPGERVDFLIKIEVIKVTHVKGQNLCKGQIRYGLNAGMSEKTEVQFKGETFSGGDNKENFEPIPPKKLDKTHINIFLPFDATIHNHFKGAVDFRYKLGEWTPYAPSILSKNLVEMYQIYNKSFLYPSSPILSQFEDVSSDILCDLKNPSDRCVSYDNGFCECTSMIHLPSNRNVDLFLIDEGKHGDVNQTVHIHGYSFHVLFTKHYGRPVSLADVERDETRGRVNRNLVNPIKKDAVVVPNKGYVVLRLNTDKPGLWLIESTTSKAKTGSGFELILNVEDVRGNLVPPPNFPTCGTMKEPDLVLSAD